MAELISQMNTSRIKIHSCSTTEEELGFLTEAEREESIKAEQALAYHKKRVKLALALATQALSEANLRKKNPIGVQAQLLRQDKEENTKELTRHERS